MQKVSYMGNDLTTEFFFDFPYFENSNVAVSINNKPATAYNIVGNSGGTNTDFPYIGGKVVFEVAPRTTDSISISRKLPLKHIADYQPLAHIEPTTLNQDLNYLIELIKDRKDELDDLVIKYTDIANKEATENLLARISAIHDEIIEIDAQITALGDLSQIRGDITDLKNGANFTATAKETIAHMATPSNRYIDLTLGVSGSTYTAPADGWFSLSKTATADGQFIQLGQYGKVSNFCWSGSQYNACITSIPVQKDQTITVDYTAGGNSTFKFYYANGAQ